MLQVELDRDMMLMMEYVQRINNGVRLLDQHYPGWMYDIYLPNLDLIHPAKCVLGQIANARNSDFEAEVYRLARELQINPIDLITRHGFSSGVVDNHTATALWFEQVRALRNPAMILVA